MLVSSITNEDLTLELIDRLQFQGLEDTGGDVDYIIVLGSAKASKYRVPVASDIYKSGEQIKYCYTVENYGISQMATLVNTQFGDHAISLPQAY